MDEALATILRDIVTAVTRAAVAVEDLAASVRTAAAASLVLAQEQRQVRPAKRPAGADDNVDDDEHDDDSIPPAEWYLTLPWGQAGDDARLWPLLQRYVAQLLELPATEEVLLQSSASTARLDAIRPSFVVMDEDLPGAGRAVLVGRPGWGARALVLYARPPSDAEADMTAERLAARLGSAETETATAPAGVVVYTTHPLDRDRAACGAVAQFFHWVATAESREIPYFVAERYLPAVSLARLARACKALHAVAVPTLAVLMAARSACAAGGGALQPQHCTLLMRHRLWHRVDVMRVMAEYVSGGQSPLSAAQARVLLELCRRICGGEEFGKALEQLVNTATELRRGQGMA